MVYQENQYHGTPLSASSISYHAVREVLTDNAIAESDHLDIRSSAVAGSKAFFSLMLSPVASCPLKASNNFWLLGIENTSIVRVHRIHSLTGTGPRMSTPETLRNDMVIEATTPWRRNRNCKWHGSDKPPTTLSYMPRAQYRTLRRPRLMTLRIPTQFGNAR